MSDPTPAPRPAAGALIDRSRPLRFTFEGQERVGYAGDTLASALLADGNRVLGRSFKYHRPRGLMGVGVEEPNILVQLGVGGRSTPNLRATEVELYEGLVARPVNCWPNAAHDLGAINNWASRFMAAGFYYKTFMWPRWTLFEPWIRKAAGLGRAPMEADPDRYESRHAHCDVLVVGAGPAGLAAARAAADTGARVMLVEQDVLAGASLLDEEATVDGQTAAEWARDTVADLARRSDVQVLTRTTAVGYYDDNLVALLERCADESICIGRPGAVRMRLWQVRAKQVVLATGAIERPLVFPGNDRPGVMLASAVRQYLARYGVVAGREAVIFTNNDEAYLTALKLLDAGARVAAVLDARGMPPADLASELTTRGVEVIAGARVVGTQGRPTLRRVEVRFSGGGRRSIACDLLAMSGGFNPTVHLFSQSGGRLRFDDKAAAFVPDAPSQLLCSVGACAGRLLLADALADGHAAGVTAAGGTVQAAQAPKTSSGRALSALAALWRIDGRAKAFVDFLNDVTTGDIDLAHAESFVSVEHLKRYTTLGMAPDQGKTSNVNALAIMAGLTGKGIEETGATRYRPPFTPVALAAFGGLDRGALFRPLRTMPAHEEHLALGASMEDYGGWLRPTVYPCAGEDGQSATVREALAVRRAAGLFEGSPLGKIEVVGPDAARFLDRIYANAVAGLRVGQVRYGLMLNELGVILDDGVVARLAEDRFLVCTTSGGAARIAAWLEEWLQCEWVEDDVLIAPVTTAWGVLTLTGPKARAILSRLGVSFQLAAGDFPHMSYREGEVGGVPARVLRVSYTGEVSYEINVPSGEARELWRRLMEAGADDGLQPVGIDAWDLLRTEKGYLHVGTDTDGTTTPLDVGWGRVLRKSGDFVGRRSLLLPENQRADRLQFVGFEPQRPRVALPIGAHVPGPTGTGSQGYVTSSIHSPVLDRTVAIGMLAGGAGRIGEVVSIQIAGATEAALVTAPGAYDPDGERLNA